MDDMIIIRRPDSAAPVTIGDLRTLADAFEQHRRLSEFCADTDNAAIAQDLRVHWRYGSSTPGYVELEREVTAIVRERFAEIRAEAERRALRRLETAAAAVGLVARAGLEDAGSEAPGEVSIDASMEGRACLTHLAAAMRVLPPGWKVTASHGLRFDDDCVLVADRHPALEAMFARSPWSGGAWRRPLLSLPGARQITAAQRFGEAVSKATALPRALFDGE